MTNFAQFVIKCGQNVYSFFYVKQTTSAILKFFIILLTKKLTSIKIRCPFLLIIKDIEQENEGELKNKK